MALKWQTFIRSFVDNEGYKNVLDGLKNTAYIALIGFVIGVIIGSLIAIVKVASKTQRFSEFPFENR